MFLAPGRQHPYLRHCVYPIQGRPVRALGDAYMHHGQSRGKRNTHKVWKKQVNFSKTGGKFFKIGRK